MRSTIALLLGLAAIAPACGRDENAGAEAVRQQAKQAAKQQGAVEPAKTIKPPVPNGAKLPCSQLLDPAALGTAIGETVPVTIKDSKSEPDAAASCSVVRGGKPLTEAEQKAKIKKDGRLGVMPGDEICNISAFCSTIEDPDTFKARCLQQKETMEDTLGFPACVLIVATGADDVKRFRFYDSDTKCILQVRGGPSNVDNDLIGKCAKAAHDMIGPAQIAIGAAPAAPAPAGSAAGSGA